MEARFFKTGTPLLRTQLIKSGPPGQISFLINSKSTD
jgi:hypothetical protein